MPQKQTQCSQRRIPFSRKNLDILASIQKNQLEALARWCAENDPSAQIEIKETKEYCTLLHLAAYYGWREGVDYLLARTTELGPSDFNDLTPLQMAIHQGNDEIETLLLDKISEQHDNQLLKYYIDQKKWTLAEKLFYQMSSGNKRLTLLGDNLNKLLVHTIDTQNWRLAEDCFIKIDKSQLTLLEGYSNPLLKNFIREEKWQLSEDLFIEMYSKGHALTVPAKYVNQFLYHTSIHGKEVTPTLLGEMHLRRYPMTLPKSSANQLLENCIGKEKWELARYVLYQTYEQGYPITVSDRAYQCLYTYAEEHNIRAILDILPPPSNRARRHRPSDTDRTFYEGSKDTVTITTYRYTRGSTIRIT